MSQYQYHYIYKVTLNNPELFIYVFVYRIEANQQQCIQISFICSFAGRYYHPGVSILT